VSLINWLVVIPRYFVGHCIGHAALLMQWTSMALEGLASALMDMTRWFCDIAEDEEVYGGFDDFDDDDDGGLTC
jgi:hypothetical protein